MDLTFVPTVGDVKVMEAREVHLSISSAAVILNPLRPNARTDDLDSISRFYVGQQRQRKNIWDLNQKNAGFTQETYTIVKTITEVLLTKVVAGVQRHKTLFLPHSDGETVRAIVCLRTSSDDGDVVWEPILQLLVERILEVNPPDYYSRVDIYLWIGAAAGDRTKGASGIYHVFQDFKVSKREELHNHTEWTSIFLGRSNELLLAYFLGDAGCVDGSWYEEIFQARRTLKAAPEHSIWITHLDQLVRNLLPRKLHASPLSAGRLDQAGPRWWVVPLVDLHSFFKLSLRHLVYPTAPFAIWKRTEMAFAKAARDAMVVGPEGKTAEWRARSSEYANYFSMRGRQCVDPFGAHASTKGKKVTSLGGVARAVFRQEFPSLEERSQERSQRVPGWRWAGRRRLCRRLSARDNRAFHGEGDSSRFGRAKMPEWHF